jgi:hypothetical protein
VSTELEIARFAAQLAVTLVEVISRAITEGDVDTVSALAPYLPTAQAIDLRDRVLQSSQRARAERELRGVHAEAKRREGDDAASTASPGSDFWMFAIRHNGAEAVLDALEAFAASPDPKGFEKNALSAVADLIADAFKRRVLAEYLRFYRGDLTAVARELRMGSNSSPVARAVRDLGLEDELRRIREETGPPKPRE